MSIEKKILLSVYVDDIRKVGSKESCPPMLARLRKKMELEDYIPSSNQLVITPDRDKVRQVTKLHQQNRYDHARVLIVTHEDSFLKKAANKESQLCSRSTCADACKTWHAMSLSCPPSQLMTDKHEDCWRLKIVYQNMLLTLPICVKQLTSFKENILHRSHTSASVLSTSQSMSLRWQSRSCRSSTRGSTIKTWEESLQPRAKPRGSVEEQRLYRSCSTEVSESNTLKTVENMGKVAKLRRRLDRAEI